MKTNRLLDVLLMVSAASIISCSPVIYSTVGQNTPMFKEKGEFSINAGYSAAMSSDDLTDIEGLSIQTAYAFDNRWAAIGSLYSLKNAVEADDTYNWKGNGTYWELGGGRYGKLGTDWWAYEVFAGLGSASIKNEDHLSSDFLDINFTKPFVQPSIGFIHKYVDVIFTPRIGYLIFSDPTFKFGQGEVAYEMPKDGFVFEPGVTLRGGYQGIKLQIQYNYSTYSFGSNADLQAGVNNRFFSIGLHVLISDRYNK
jgi:hypothetical protein